MKSCAMLFSIEGFQQLQNAKETRDIYIIAKVIDKKLGYVTYGAEWTFF